MLNWEEIKQKMREGVVFVSFKKANGEIREMQCTLADYLLPETAGTRANTNDDIVVVFDIEKEAWRSFRKDTVIEVWEEE